MIEDIDIFHILDNEKLEKTITVVPVEKAEDALNTLAKRYQARLSEKDEEIASLNRVIDSMGCAFIEAGCADKLRDHSVFDNDEDPFELSKEDFDEYIDEAMSMATHEDFYVGNPDFEFDINEEMIGMLTTEPRIIMFDLHIGNIKDDSEVIEECHKKQ